MPSQPYNIVETLKNKVWYSGRACGAGGISAKYCIFTHGYINDFLTLLVSAFIRDYSLQNNYINQYHHCPVNKNKTGDTCNKNDTLSLLLYGKCSIKHY